jgi:exosortase/archaeosortase
LHTNKLETIPDYTQVRDYIRYYGWISFANFQIMKFQRYKLALNYFNFCLNFISVMFIKR